MGLEQSAHTWFEGKAPRTKVPADWIESALSG
jgi:hypothetical protein